MERKFTSRFMETVTINREHAVGLSGQFGKLCFRRWETVRRAANVAERRSDKMNVFIFLITGIYLSVMAIDSKRFRYFPA